MKKGIITIIMILIGIVLIVVGLYPKKEDTTTVLKVNLTNLTFKESGENLKSYKIEEFTQFVNDYKNQNLPSVYLTDFLFDGVSMYKPYDLDDFIEGGNDILVDPLEIKTLNINTNGLVELSGSMKGMIAVNSNNLEDDLTIILNGVEIDTDSKKAPAIYVYNKDVTYSKNKVIIELKENTKNYITGGKLKKVSLIPSDELNNFTNKYSNTNKENYEILSKYYGIYTNSEINSILFAKVEADNEDLNDGDPVYFYKASGAISSDIDLTFQGSGSLEVISKNKEGIETKGNLTIGNKNGDYVIKAMDDCLNTTTDSKKISNARNTLTIDVNSLYAIVLADADEGDAIDSNGELIINGGKIVAIAKSGSDAGIDSESGTFINKGMVLATGDMYDDVKSDSTQNFMVLSFSNQILENDIITLLDNENNVVFSYKTDRSYSNLIYSSNTLTNGSYSLYKNGVITGENEYGLYTSILNYEKGLNLGYTTKGQIGGMDGNKLNDNQERNNNENKMDPNITPPDKKDSNISKVNPFDSNSNLKASNKEFIIDGISNLFSGVSEYSE